MDLYTKPQLNGPSRGIDDDEHPEEELIAAVDMIDGDDPVGETEDSSARGAQASVEATTADEALVDEEPENGEESKISGATDGTGNLVRDNLKRIKGVGPAIEKTLNEMGIFRFHQIAEMSEYDIDRVAHRLKGFRSRIYREDWMGQARELLLQQASG